MAALEDKVYYADKYRVYIQIGKGANREGPPEAKWYGLWNLFLNHIAAQDKYLLVFPQLDFRVQTDNPVGKINKSTRFTDFGLLDHMAIEVPQPQGPPLITIVMRKPLIFLEVKPDETYREQAEWDLLEQIRHHFWMQEKESNVEVIAISAVGDEWGWANVRRSVGTSPAGQSDRAAVVYMQQKEAVADIIPRPGNPNGGPWSPYVTVGTPESDRQLLDVLALMNERRLDH